jgi:hypothetical protein
MLPWWVDRPHLPAGSWQLSRKIPRRWHRALERLSDRVVSTVVTVFRLHHTYWESRCQYRHIYGDDELSGIVSFLPRVRDRIYRTTQNVWTANAIFTFLSGFHAL